MNIYYVFLMKTNIHMDYLFENLLDERFQEFCNVLVNKKNQNVQSFPVGQPDGGRDAISYINDNKDFIVYQVKYVRNPKTIIDPHKWLLKIIKDEISKIDNLIPKGAIKYVLITNVSGTAHLDSGSIDKLNKVLEENIQIPSICWWRDDLCRMIEEDPLFKWNFPEILNGQDILNNVLFEYINKDKERIKSIVTAYLADQYALDNEVKFKQIDLHNKTLDLYVDVPIKVKKYNLKDKLLRKTIGKSIETEQYFLDGDTFYIPADKNRKAAEFIIDSLVQNNIQRILLEGGPGQGKSTISQFLCQINRIKLLNKESDLKKISDTFKNSPVRLPIKIDLRHVASWISKRNPYEGSFNQEKFNLINNNSLESFLQGNFIYHSKIESITTDDIINIFKSSSVLIVFDGFDEIADLKLRQDVIDLINRGINRLIENSKSIQVVVTSRPAAFTENVDFPIELYPRFELSDLDGEVTNEYVEKWTNVNKLDSREKQFIKILVREKLQQAHIKELTKSPMQLAIFLSLLRTRGESLPNKRTALYDSYIELFFNREAEKNSLIRDKRDLIINIHEYLGWILHSEAELFNTNGIITLEALKERLQSYLSYEGHETNITDQLFDVLKERVCALVSRTQGTFEFEVQPLREYFCAKYLYNTAPYANYGKDEVQGTKPDRFKAILRNTYWQNVTRFYAGCFDKGELPMLIHELKELSNDKDYENTSYVKLITSQLLSDWVFTQYPNLLKDIINIIIDGISKGELVNQDKHNLFSSPINVPNECGRKELVTRAFEQLLTFPKLDYANQLISLLVNNPERNTERWLELYNNLPNDKIEKWFLYGYKIRILHNITDEFVMDFLNNDNIPHKDYIYKYLVNGNALSEKTLSENLKSLLLENILDRKLYIQGNDPSNKKLDLLGFISLMLNNHYLHNIISSKNSEMQFGFYVNKQFENIEFKNEDKVDELILKFKNEINPFLLSSINDLKNNSDYWVLLVDALSKNFTEKDSVRDLCINLVFRLKFKSENIDDHDDLFNAKNSLFKRFNNARYKSGNVTYWRENLKKYINSKEKSYLLMILLLFATPRAVIALASEIEKGIKKLSDESFNLLINHLFMFQTLNNFPKKYENEIENFIGYNNVSDRFKSLISVRYGERNRYKFLVNNFSTKININIINSEILQHLCTEMLKSDDYSLLDKIKEVYSSISNSSDPLEFIRYSIKLNDKNLSIDTAKKIMSDAEKFPQLLVSFSEKKCFDEVCTTMIPVGKIAKEENWFIN